MPIWLPSQKPPRGSRIDLAHPLCRKLAGAWIMNELSGGKCYDLSGNGQHLTWAANSPRWYGHYVNFDTGVEYMSYTDPQALIFPDVSFSIVVRFRSSAATNQYIINKNYGAGTTKWWGCSVDGSTGGDFAIQVDDGNAYESGYDSSNSADGNWHTNVAIRDREQDLLYVYVDGVYGDNPVEDTRTATVDPGTGAFWIGGRTDGSADRDFVGDIEFAYIFKRTLSADDVSWITAEPYIMFRRPAKAKYFDLWVGDSSSTGPVYTWEIADLTLSVEAAILQDAAVDAAQLADVPTGVRTTQAVSPDGTVLTDTPVGVSLTGTVTWGHDTGVVEDKARDFGDDWAGSGEASGSGDAEILVLAGSEYMECTAWHIGSGNVRLRTDVYDTGKGTPTVYYKQGATKAACEADTWHEYGSAFSCGGWVKIKVENAG